MIIGSFARHKGGDSAQYRLISAVRDLLRRCESHYEVPSNRTEEYADYTKYTQKYGWKDNYSLSAVVSSNETHFTIALSAAENDPSTLSAADQVFRAVRRINDKIEYYYRRTMSNYKFGQTDVSITTSSVAKRARHCRPHSV